MSRPDIIDKNKASSHPLRPGRFYTARIKKVNTDGKVTVFIQELGLSIGPVAPLNLVDNNPYSVDDYVKCTFADEFFNELIIFGSVIKKESVYALKTEAGSTWTSVNPIINQGPSTNIANIPNYSKYATIGSMRTWNCLTSIGGSGTMDEPVLIELPEPSVSGAAGLVVGNALLILSSGTYMANVLIFGEAGEYICFFRESYSFFGVTPSVQLGFEDSISFSISYEVAV